MAAISIRTVADLRRALGLPGVLVILDRHDGMGPYLARDPVRMADAMAPRTVKSVRGKDAILLKAGQPVYMEMPRAGDLVADGTHAFGLVDRGADGRPDRLRSYRLAVPGTPEAAVPSRLPESHPPLCADALAAEAAAAAGLEAGRRALDEAHRAERARVAAIAPPAEDPRHAALTAAMRAAIAGALAEGLLYNAHVDDFVTARLGEAEYARMRRLPDAGPPPGGGTMEALARDEAALALGREPRGSYRAFVVGGGAARMMSATLVSSGGGRPADKFEASLADEGPAAVLRRMQEGEIYDLRRRMRREAGAEAAGEAMARRRFAVGQTFRKVRIGSATYSTARAVAVDAEAGTVSLELCKQGSRMLYKGTLRADALDLACPEEAPAAGSLGI